MNLEKNIQEFKNFLAGKYDTYMVTRGEQFADWNYFKKTYFDKLSSDDQKYIFYSLFNEVCERDLVRVLGYTHWIDIPPTEYMQFFVDVYLHNKCSDKKQKIFLSGFLND
ncbi:hypothetical protein [Pasteurella atlantica]|uniref:hypothetical protein n=1 Tax=Pasteurellaceae TaxID=712 RepID=UPI002772DA8E|nr:hypothetical protein [Pasteurella atlantica]MDP8100102.1 hypothetical protein [Pasteurella atlantica]MDP8106229.1 hypothetical protein [Pasteurella atlantica]MDP8115958.1 hypothetical protein [Pasteurella atlantica]